jgi:hypothetical protein
MQERCDEGFGNQRGFREEIAVERLRGKAHGTGGKQLPVCGMRSLLLGQAVVFVHHCIKLGQLGPGLI